MEKDLNSNLDCAADKLSPSSRLARLNAKPEPSEQGISSAMVPDSNVYSNNLSQMPDTPSMNGHYRRTHSDILTLSDDLTYDSDLGVVETADEPGLSDETDEDLFFMYLDMEKVVEKMSLIEQYRMERERQLKLGEKEEIKRLIKELVPKAQPMPYFDRPFVPKRSMMQPTIPKGPKFHVNHHNKRHCMSLANLTTYPQNQKPHILGASLLLAKLAMEDGLLDGVLNNVHGTNDVVNAICDNDDVRVVPFVGSNNSSMTGVESKN